jgi:uncharacterized OB-fold protein
MISNPGNPGKITSKRCTRCGVVQTQVPSNGLCTSCTKWAAKKK